MIDLPSILAHLPVGVWVGNVPDGSVAYANNAFEEIMGRKAVPGVPIGDAPIAYTLLDRQGRPYPASQLAFARVAATGRPTVIDDLVVRRADRDVNIRAFGAPIFEPTGRLTHVIVAFIDITREVAAEAQRRTVESRLQFVCSHAPIVIWLADNQGNVTLSEGAGLEALGFKAGELVGRNVFDLYGGHPTIPGYLRRVIAGESLWYTVEVGEVVFETWLSPVYGPSGEQIGFMGMGNDVSQVRKLQKTAIQNDRVMALGTLAASVAHEINNPLTYVLVESEAATREVDALERLVGSLAAAAAPEVRGSLSRLREHLAPIRAGTTRIASITRDLKSFSRADESTLSAVNLRAIVESVLKLVAKEVEARARLVLDLYDTSPVTGNEARLTQVVLNLIVNAYQAVPQGAPAQNQVKVATRSEGSRVIVEVSDSGPGVPPQDRERIFEPFFTTKAIGVGTGLGLFVCRNVVRGFAGEVEVHDAPGGGALFRVVLPAAQGPARAPDAVSAAATPDTTGAHIVLVEDDRMVARAFMLRLREAGYRVTIFHDGRSGIDGLLAMPDDQIDLIFCDLMMTGMTGMDLAAALTSRAPAKAAKLVLMTGGAFSAEASEFVARHQDRIVDKPFDIITEIQRRLGPAPRSQT